MSQFQISPLMIERLGWVLVHSLWQFAFIALLAGVAMRLLRRNSAAVRHRVLGLAIAATVIMPVVTWTLQPVHSMTNPVRRPEPALEQETKSGSVSNVSRNPEVGSLPGDRQNVRPLHSIDEDPTFAKADSSRFAGPPFAAPVESRSTSFLNENQRDKGSWWVRLTLVLRPWLTWIVGGWCIGVLLCSLRPLLGWHMLWRLRRVGTSPVSNEVLAAIERVSVRIGMRRDVRVLYSTLARVPVVVGYLKPVILLPLSLMTTLSTTQLDAILAHELSHIRRHDFLINVLQTLVETIFFFHPAVWWLSNRLRAEREYCCDDLVIARLGNRIEYGRALLAIEEMRGRNAVMAVGAADGSLLARIRRIIGVPTDIPGSSPWSMISLFVACIVVIGAIAVLSWPSQAESLEPATTPPAKPERYVALLPDGVEVEFVGLAPGSGDVQDANVWWKPDGTRLGFAPTFKGARSVENNPSYVNTVTRVRGITDTSAVSATAAIASAENEKDASGKLAVAHYGHTDIPEGETTRSFEVGVATETLSPKRMLGRDGKRIRPAVGSDSDSIAEDITVEKLGSATWGTREVNGRLVPVDPANGPQKTRRESTQLTLRIPRIWRTVDLRMNAIDKAGKSHAVDMTVQLVPNDKNASYKRFAKLFDVPFDDIDRIEYQFRCFRHWVTFEHVSLVAGMESDVKVTVESLPVAAADPQDMPMATKTLARNWGQPTNGLRARMVPVRSSMSEDVIDLTQSLDRFAKAEDLAFAVELENVSNKPIKLLDTRYGDGYGESKGKANSDWYAQFLFSVDLFDRDGKRIERSEVQVVDVNGVLDGVLVATLEPGQSHRFLLRPTKWLSPMTQRIGPGSYRAAVRYHGLPTRVATRIKEYRPDSVVLAAMAGDVATPQVAFEVLPPVNPGAEKDAPKDVQAVKPTLAWGESSDGLRAALEFIPQQGTHAHGEKPEAKLHVQNVSGQPITLASQLWMSDLKAAVEDNKGQSLKVGSTWYSGWTLTSRVTLKPKQVIIYDAGNVGLAISKDRAKTFEHITHRTLVAPAGKYTMQLNGRFGDSFLLKDGQGKVLAPLKGDWIGELKTGEAQLTITQERIACDIVDAETAEPVAGTTVNFRFIKPKSGDMAEEVVADMYWGPKAPGRIYFAIPGEVMKRADREEIVVQWSIGQHSDYKPLSPKKRIPLKQFFKEGTKAARETLGTIKLTPKKKVGAAAPPKGLEFLAPYPKLHGLSLDITEQQFLAIVEREKLNSQKSVNAGGNHYWISADDDHSVIVMFGNNGNKCDGIQRVRGQWTPPIRVMLKLKRKEFLLGESITIDYEVTNNGLEAAPYGKGAFYPALRINDGYRMSATKVDNDGKPIGKAVKKWPMPENFGGPAGGLKLKPRESYSTTLFVTRYLKFLEPGRYLLRVENVDRLAQDSQKAWSSGETYLTLKQPTLEQTREVFEQMKQSPQKAYDDNAMNFLPEAADFQAIHQPVYLPILKEFAQQGDRDALQSLERMERLDANEVLVATLASALDRDDWRTGRACFQHLKKSLPFPNWYKEPLAAYDQPNRDRVARLWKLDFRPSLTRLAKRMNVEVAQMMQNRKAKPLDADANNPEFLKVFRTGYFPPEHPQSLLIDIDFIYRCLGQPDDFRDCLAAYAHSIELTKSLPLETNQYFRPRGSAFGFGHTVRYMLKRGAKPLNMPTHPGEAAAFAIAIYTQESFRPAGWQTELMKWLKFGSPYLAEVILDRLPDPIPAAVLDHLPNALADDYVDLQIAACRVAEKHPRSAYRKPIQRILDTAKDQYLRKFAVDAAQANRIKARYDPNAPFVDQ